MLCKTCNKETTNPKYCSLSCSAKYNNTKRTKIRYCTRCNNQIEGKSPNKKLCYSCRYPDKSLAELLYDKGHRSNVYSHVRSKARLCARKFGLLDRCNVCGYSKHVEACHIKPISTYKPKTMISVINSRENLIGLCPNCHWEFDHNLLRISEIES